MLLLAGTRARRAQTAGRMRKLCEQMSWDALLTDLAHQGLIPLLGGRLLEVPGAPRPARLHPRRAGRRPRRGEGPGR